METRDYLRQKKYELKGVESDGFISSSKLLDLLTNEKLKQYICKKYQLEQDIEIRLDKIDVVYRHVKRYSSRFKLLRIKNSFKNITTESKVDTETGKNRVFFLIKDSIDEAGVLYEEIEAEAIYDSLGMFYDKRKLTTYVNYLKEIKNSKSLLKELNESWQQYYEDYPDAAENKIFRILDDGEKQYLKSINSDRYNEWGIAETFVISMLELFKLSNLNIKTTFYISSVAISECKIDIIVRSNQSKYIKDLGHVYSSISIRNKDQGNTSIGLYSSLEFLLEKEIDGEVYLFPNRKIDGIEHKFTMNHSVTVPVFVDGYENISTLLREIDNFEQDYYAFKDAVDYDELRGKIEQKVINNNSPFKGIAEVTDLFKKDKVGHITNLESLLRLCVKTEVLKKLDFDLKFRLRYIISNVLLYGKADID